MALAEAGLTSLSRPLESQARVVELLEQDPPVLALLVAGLLQVVGMPEGARIRAQDLELPAFAEVLTGVHRFLFLLGATASRCGGRSGCSCCTTVRHGGSV
jgi:hypothetical protein